MNRDAGLADFLLDNYGHCIRGAQCLCLRPGSVWLGRGCSSWRSVGATTYEELEAEDQKVYDYYSLGGIK